MDLDTILRDLDLESDEEHEEVINEANESETLKKVRAWGKQQEKDKKELAKVVKELSAFRETIETTRKESAAGEAFKEIGLSEKQAKLFLRDFEGDEITTEVVKEWAVEYDLVSAEGGKPAPKNEGFVPNHLSNPSVFANSGKMTTEEWNNLKKNNPGAALQALSDGTYTPNLSLDN